MKRFATLLLALIMILSLAAPTFAAETTGTIVNDTDRTYNAYQIFKGTQAVDSDVLGDINWGNAFGSNTYSFSATLKALVVNGTTPFASITDAASIADVLNNKSDNSDIAKAFAELAYKYINVNYAVPVTEEETVLTSGYYLLVDVTEGKPTVNPALLQVTNGTMHITEKTDEPGFDKLTVNGNGKFDTAAIGESVIFELRAELPNNVDAYDPYKVVFHDRLSAGLTFNNDIKVYLNNTNNEITSGFSVVTSDLKDDCSFEVVINNVEAIGASNEDTILVRYTATLNENAVITNVGNPNFAKLEYSNNPNTTDTGKTPEKKAVVFTFKVIVDKTDENGNELPGAGFTLYKKDTNGNWVQVDEELTGEALTKFVWSGLDAGNYKLEETTTPAGYNTIDPIEFKIEAYCDLTAEDPVLDYMSDSGPFVADLENLTLSAEIINQSGSTLPETGGMGTTLFYIFGGVMMLAAVVLLVTKKRMANT